MAIELMASNNATGTTTTNRSAAITQVAGLNKIALMGVMFDGAPNVTPTVTYGGVAMTKLSGGDNTNLTNNQGAMLYYLLNASFPADGSRSFSAVFSGNCSWLGICGAVFTGVKQDGWGTNYNWTNTGNGNTVMGYTWTGLPDGSLHFTTAWHGTSASCTPTSPALEIYDSTNYGTTVYALGGQQALTTSGGSGFATWVSAWFPALLGSLPIQNNNY